MRKRTPGRNKPQSLSRRQFLRASGMTALLAALPTGWSGRVFASDAPETPRIRIGIIALTDCASIVMAHEKGFFKQHGLDVTVAKEASWAVIRDKLQLGENHHHDTSPVDEPPGESVRFYRGVRREESQHRQSRSQGIARVEYVYRQDRESLRSRGDRLAPVLHQLPRRVFRSNETRRIRRLLCGEKPYGELGKIKRQKSKGKRQKAKVKSAKK
jgi:hypothetical protein